MIDYIRNYLTDLDFEIIQIEKEMEKKGIKNKPLKGIDDYFQSIEELEKAGLIERHGYNLISPWARPRPNPWKN